MTQFEDMVRDYINETGNHVAYRVTPIFVGNNLVCNGVQMEAFSVEDNGEGICFNVYCYNVQPGVTIDYFTGVNVANGEPLPEIDIENDNREETMNGNSGSGSGDNGDEENNSNTDNSEHKGTIDNCDYIINTNSNKFHRPDSKCINDSFKEQNREYYIGTKEELEADGYVACKICKP
jgi:DNA-entry nuclease